jgi:arylsulfatase
MVSFYTRTLNTTQLKENRHLGMTKEIAPCSRGFDKNFSLLPGASNHYNYEPQLDDGEFQAPCINTTGFWMEGEKILDRTADLPKHFYSTRTFTDKMIGFLENRTEKESQKPFFAYLPYTAPHWPLQAPREIIEKYGKYFIANDDRARTNWFQRASMMTDLMP